MENQQNIHWVYMKKKSLTNYTYQKRLNYNCPHARIQEGNVFSRVSF